MNKFSGASHRSFLSRDDALKAFGAYMDNQVSLSSSASASESESRKTTRADKLVKLEDALSTLANENNRHVSSVVEIMEDIKQKIKSLHIVGDD